MKKLLKKLALLPLFCGLVLTSACSNDDENGNDNNNDIPTSWFDGTITATVVNGNDYNDLINRVGAPAVILNFESGDVSEDFVEIASATWSNGGFTITLPTTPDDKFFTPFIEGLPVNINVSDRNARTVMVGFDGIAFFAYDHTNEFVGVLSYGSAETFVVFMYADRDVTIVGMLGSAMYNMSLRRGWNKVFATYTETEVEVIVSTQAVSGLKWYFEEGHQWLPMAIKNTTQSRSIFSRLGR